jgi:hypothetical protein
MFIGKLKKESLRKECNAEPKGKRTLAPGVEPGSPRDLAARQY